MNVASGICRRCKNLRNNGVVPSPTPMVPIRLDSISVIRQPFIDYQGKPQRWTLSAQQGVLQHQSEVFELQEQVNLTRFDANDRMQLSTERMILTTQNDLVVIPQRLQLSTGSLQLQANSATLDVSNNQYRFNGVKATYQDRGIHETG